MVGRIKNPFHYPWVASSNITYKRINDVVFCSFDPKVMKFHFQKWIHQLMICYQYWVYEKIYLKLELFYIKSQLVIGLTGRDRDWGWWWFLMEHFAKQGRGFHVADPNKMRITPQNLISYKTQWSFYETYSGKMYAVIKLEMLKAVSNLSVGHLNDPLRDAFDNWILPGALIPMAINSRRYV